MSGSGHHNVGEDTVGTGGSDAGARKVMPLLLLFVNPPVSMSVSPLFMSHHKVMPPLFRLKTRSEVQLLRCLHSA